MAHEGARRAHGNAFLRYSEKYSYDINGSILSIQYCHDGRQYPGRTKQYLYLDVLSDEEGTYTNPHPR